MRLVVAFLAAVAACSPAAQLSTTTSAPPPTSTAVVPITTTTTATTLPSSSTTSTLPLEETGLRMEADLAGLLAIGPRPGGSEAERRAAVYLEDRLETILGAVQSEEVPLRDGSSSLNLFGVTGEGPLEVLLGAHYDTVPVSPGADDNGSGTVVLLELARQLRQRPVPGLRVTIAFFGAEEVLTGYGRNAHHFGSRLSSSRLAETDSLPDRMVSVDMVGLGDRLLAVTYLDTDLLVAEELQAAGAALGMEITIESRGDISDHESFARAGVPAAFLWRPDNPAWHTAEDDEVRVELLLEDLAVLEELLNRLGTGELFASRLAH
ncbi:MAG: M28 family metallopeptidase [Acidimicrobiia bacterium]